jgi:DNA-binding transcriptional LysR family regulator
LTNHATLMTSSGHASSRELRFAGPDGEVSVPLRPALVANDIEVLRQAALNGMGIGFLPSALVQDDIRDDRLVCLLGDYRLPDLTLHIVYASRRHLPVKIRTFIDHLVSWFGDDAGSLLSGDRAGDASTTRSPLSNLTAEPAGLSVGR